MPVVPLAGTWIEIFAMKYLFIDEVVVPLAGTWIEIDQRIGPQDSQKGRSPCGNVD